LGIPVAQLPAGIAQCPQPVLTLQVLRERHVVPGERAARVVSLIPKRGAQETKKKEYLHPQQPNPTLAVVDLLHDSLSLSAALHCSLTSAG
jgi:hypothetical protein